MSEVQKSIRGHVAADPDGGGHHRSSPQPAASALLSAHDDGVTWVDRTSAGGQTRLSRPISLPADLAKRRGIRVGDQLVAYRRYPHPPVARCSGSALATFRYCGQTTIHAAPRRDRISKRPHFHPGGPARYRLCTTSMRSAFLTWRSACFVYYRRTSAAKSLHFFMLCLVSFIGSCFHYSGKLNTFDEIMYWGNLARRLDRAQPCSCIFA